MTLFSCLKVVTVTGEVLSLEMVMNLFLIGHVLHCIHHKFAFLRVKRVECKIHVAIDLGKRLCGQLKPSISNIIL